MLSFDMLAAEIGINLGLRAHTVCIADIFHLPQRTTISDWRPSIFNDVVKAVTRVSSNRKEY